jgi:phosphatidylinositol glycan class B
VNPDRDPARTGVLPRLQASLPGTPAGLLVWAAVAIAVASAWFNEGFFSHDEHFQILEFAWYKLGRTPADALAWEFHAHMRAGLQPWLAAGLFRSLDALRVFTPFTAAFVLRVITGLLAVWVSLQLVLRALPAVRDPFLRRVLFLGALFLWFLPYTHGRFASENWGGLLFFAGLCLVSHDFERPVDRTPVLGGVLAGLLWSAAFYCRFQVGLAIAGAGLWLVLIGRAPVRLLVTMTAAFALGCALNTTIDRWLYGEWVFTPYSYFYNNLVLGKAATFGTSPWWFYLEQLLMILVPPFSVLLVALLLASVWLCRRNVLVWAVLPFVFVQSTIGHKEPRFLIPMTYALVPIIVVSADRLPAALWAAIDRFVNRRALRTAAWVFSVLNVCALTVMTLKPSSETAVIYRELYQAGLKQPIVLYTASDLPYTLAGGAVAFYRPDNLTLVPFRDPAAMRIASAARPGRVFVFLQALEAPAWFAAEGLTCTPVARTLPSWAARHNVNNWTSRMYRWSVFSVATSP